MEVDRIRYIFGSFTRKKDNRKSAAEQSSISAGNSPIHITRSLRPISQASSANQGVPNCQNLNIPPRTSAYEVDKNKEWECGICKKYLEEPRLLGCLHSFCTRCLQGLHQEGEGELWSEVDGGSIRLESGESGSGSGSAGSGYESDLRRSPSIRSWGKEKPTQVPILTRKISGKHVQFILCPRCGQETQLPLGGVAALPLNHVLMRKIAAHHVTRASVLCDLCNSDHKATWRCSQCAVSVCVTCGEAHARQPATARHALRPLGLAPAHKHCPLHPRADLSVYCATCQQVVCRDCCVSLHSGHALANASRAAAERARLLRDACARAQRTPLAAQRAASDISAHAAQAEAEGARIEAAVQSWAAQYRLAVEAHGRALSGAAARARARYRAAVSARQRELTDRAKQAVDAVSFAEELLSESREDELLSLSGPVLARLDRLSSLEPLQQPPPWELRWAPAAAAGPDCALVGRLLTSAPQPDHCRLNTEGLQDLRVGCEHAVTLELRDRDGERVWCGGEQVAGYFRRRDSSARPMTAAVTDRGDGTYTIVVKAPAPGAYMLAVTLNDKPIKGSPFECFARLSAGHSGGRCCSSCGCGSSMATGYKGGGKGQHSSNAGRPWSCCGARDNSGVTSPASIVQTPTPNDSPSQLYQFSL